MHVLLTLCLIAQSPAAAVKLTPRVVAEVDFGTLKGSVRQLAWSPDGTGLYLQSYEQNADASPKAFYHYLVSLTDGSVKKIDEEPDWASQYWSWKSNKWAPDDQAFSIDIEASTKRVSATSTPMGGDAARGDLISGTGGASAESVARAAEQTQTQNVYTMRLKGEIVGQWIDHPIVPGLTFGWGPPGSGLIAYADQDQRLVIMDKSGAKQRVGDAKGVAAPAWRADGARLAYLQSRGGKKFALVVADVSR